MGSDVTSECHLLEKLQLRLHHLTKNYKPKYVILISQHIYPTAYNFTYYEDLKATIGPSLSTFKKLINLQLSLI